MVIAHVFCPHVSELEADSVMQYRIPQRVIILRIVGQAYPLLSGMDFS